MLETTPAHTKGTLPTFVNVTIRIPEMRDEQLQAELVAKLERIPLAEQEELEIELFMEELTENIGDDSPPADFIGSENFNSSN